MHHYPVKQPYLHRREKARLAPIFNAVGTARVPEMGDCLGGSAVQNRHSASGPGCVKTRAPADGAECHFSTVVLNGGTPLMHPEMQFRRIMFSAFCSRTSFHTPGLAPDIGAFGGVYAASFGTALSTKRKHRMLHPPATNDTGDSEFPGSPVPFCRDRVLPVAATNASVPLSKLRSPRSVRGSNR